MLEEFAAQDEDSEVQEEARSRYRWVCYKVWKLNTEGHVITDAPGVWEGTQREYGGIGKASRWLNAKERQWNASLVLHETRYPPPPSGIRAKLEAERRAQQQEAQPRTLTSQATRARPPPTNDVAQMLGDGRRLRGRDLHGRAATAGSAGHRDVERPPRREPSTWHALWVRRPPPSSAPPAPQQAEHEDNPIDDDAGAAGPREEDDDAPGEESDEGPMDEGDGYAGPPENWGCGDIQFYAMEYEKMRQQAGSGRDPQVVQQEMNDTVTLTISACQESRARMEARKQAEAASAGAASAATASVHRALLPGAESRAPVTPRSGLPPWRQQTTTPPWRQQLPTPTAVKSAGPSSRPRSRERPSASRPTSGPESKPRPCSRAPGPSPQASHRGPGGGEPSSAQPKAKARPVPIRLTANVPPPKAPPPPKVLPTTSKAAPPKQQLMQQMDTDNLGLEARARQVCVDAERSRNRASGAMPRHQSAESSRATPQVSATARVQRLSSDPAVYKQIAKLPPELVANLPEKPTRSPWMILEHPHQATSPFHEDWTQVPNSWTDPEAWQEELRRRDLRNVMIMETLLDSRTVFYSSSGNSMWPIVQNGDYCLLHPIQAVTALKAPSVEIQKCESTISVGDIVFCRVQPTQQFYAHFVRQICEHAYDAENGTHATQYWIGGLPVRNNTRPLNGHAFRRHIFGILKAVFVQGDKHFLKRPHPLDTVEASQTLYDTVCPLVLQNERCPWARELCKAHESPEMVPPEDDNNVAKRRRPGH